MIPVNNTALSAQTKKYLIECIDTGWISSEGKFVKNFESAFAKYIGTKYAVAVNSGTSALHLGLLSLGLKAGDEVILPASTIGACFFAIWYWGGVAVPVDVELDTYNLDPSLIEAAITPKTKAIMVVHLYGRPANLAAIMRIARKHNLVVIEDAAEAHGATIGQRKAGSFGKIGCFSFYANKLVTSGEGGMVVTNSLKLATKVKSLRGLARSKKNRFIYDDVGFSLNMSNLQAGVGLAQLDEIEAAIKQKQAMAASYKKNLADVSGLVLPKDFETGRQVYWMYAVRIEAKKFGCSRDKLAKLLWEKYQIQTRPFFNAPKIAFKPINRFQDKAFPIAEEIGQTGLYLPSGTGQKISDFELVATAIKAIQASLK